MKDESGKDVCILQKDAASYLSEEFLSCYYVYTNTVNLETLPFAGGWAEQPEWIVAALNTIKLERQKFEDEERERKEREQKQAARRKR